MPLLENIVVQDFRNIGLQQLEFSPNINCISGNNGEGKTNLLDAIHYLSMTKSAYGGNSEKFNFRFGQKAFSIGGTFLMQEPDIRAKFSISVTDGGEKKVCRDGKQYPKISAHVGVLPIVQVSPSDTVLVSESAEYRRRFLNSVISQLDRQYLSDMQSYNRILLQRNRLLKEGNADEGLLEVFDGQLSALAVPIYERRREFVDSIGPVVSQYYQALCGGMESVSLVYRSDLARGPLDVQLKSSRQTDISFRYTTCGIHRDDIIFLLDGHPMRATGSQGQQKSFLVSLKFAQYDIMKERYGFAPMMLLDDLFDKLDLRRVANMLKMVSGSDFGQIFITDTNKVRLRGIVDELTSERSYFEASGGTFSKIQ